MALLLLRRELHLVAVDATPAEAPAPAVCAHDLHGFYCGQRLGVVVHPSGYASLSPCPHVNEDGL